MLSARTTKIKKYTKAFAEHVVDIYAYVLWVYLVSFGLSRLSPDFKHIFYWPFFHGIILIFSLAILWSDKAWGYIRTTYASPSSIFGSRMFQVFEHLVIVTAVLLVIFFHLSLAGIFAVFFALGSFFFLSTSRYSFIAALILFLACPAFFLIKKEVFAETSANYAYYFLIVGIVHEVILSGKRNPEKPLKIKKTVSRPRLRKVTSDVIMPARRKPRKTV